MAALLDPIEMHAVQRNGETINLMNNGIETDPNNRVAGSVTPTSPALSEDRNCSFIVLPASLQKYFPPRGRPAEYLTRLLICILIWASLYVIIGNDAMPGGNLFSIFVLLVAASMGGYFIGCKTRYFSFPPLLGMLLVGFMLRNINQINIAKDIKPIWSSSLRNTALVVILLRSGLGLDIEALKKLKFTVLRLAFVPCIVESITVAVTSNLLLGIPWFWAFQLGFILAAVSPAVVVPSMLSLQNDGYGIEEGIPTLVMAASSCDDVLAISMFGIFLGIAFSEGDLYFNIFRGPLEIFMGLAGGLLVGVFMWYFPYKRGNGVVACRSMLLVLFGLVFLFGSNKIGFPGAGALGILTLGATSAYGWTEKAKKPIEDVTGILWQLFQPLLFGLIGAEVKINYLNGSLVGKGIATLLIGLSLRVISTYFVVYGNGFNVKERLFCTIAWLPKATVQAAIGSIPLDTARQKGLTGKREEEIGIQIVTIAVLVILMTAPIGAIAISLAGPNWLKKVNRDNSL